jgi:hypothetical protein
MTSVLRFMKQIPTDTPYFISLLTQQNLNVFTPDAAASTTSYVSGAAAGNFTTSNVTINAFDAVADASGLSGLVLFRDMGKTIISSGRMFRRVQLLRLDGTGSTGWTSTTAGTPGVWQAGVEGVNGAPPASGDADTAYSVFYFETGARGLGVAQGLVRYG